MHWGSWTTHHVARKEWNVVLNPLRQVQYCHVKSGKACFQMPENPGVLNKLILKGESVASRANDDTGACEHEDSRPGRKRKDRHQSEQHKSKFTRCDHHRSGSQYMENLVMDQSPSHWIDPFRAKLDKRSVTQIAPTVESPSRCIIELKRIARWRGDKSRISQASEAAAGCVERPPRGSRIRDRPEGFSSTSTHHREHATTSLTLHSSPSASPSSRN